MIEAVASVQALPEDKKEPPGEAISWRAAFCTA